MVENINPYVIVLGTGWSMVHSFKVVENASQSSVSTSYRPSVKQATTITINHSPLSTIGHHYHPLLSSTDTNVSNNWDQFGKKPCAMLFQHNRPRVIGSVLRTDRRQWLRYLGDPKMEAVSSVTLVICINEQWPSQNTSSANPWIWLNLLRHWDAVIMVKLSDVGPVRALVEGQLSIFRRCHWTYRRCPYTRW